ncbi:MAG: hypothetical protein JW963_23490 [Anaerolineales bacterium]|nr:hypothetical protein [Anaerolineales bacterium]
MIKLHSILLRITALWMAIFACRPVIAIGWPELIVLILLIAILMGPLMFRLYWFLEKIRRANKTKEKK